jgi:hypothetical protein
MWANAPFGDRRAAARASVLRALVLVCTGCGATDGSGANAGNPGTAGGGAIAAAAGASGSLGSAGVVGAGASGGAGSGGTHGAGTGSAGAAGIGGARGGGAGGANGAGTGGASEAGTGGANAAGENGGGAGMGGEGGGGSSGSGGEGSEITCDLPTSFQWTSSGVLVAPKPNPSHAIISVKDPTIVFHEGEYLLYATTANTAGNWNMVHLSFDDFDSAADAPFYYMDATAGFSGYHCAPNLFYFEPDGLWYLVQQSQPPQYSTSDDPADPTSWTAPQYFYPNGNHLPAGAPSLPIDYWVICDDAKCHLFFTGDDGHLYRAETDIDDFPSGFGALQTVLSDSERFDLFEGSAHYKVKGRNQYLTIIEAIGGGGRYYRSWTATSLEGPWTPLADTEQNPFAGRNNVTYEQGVADWTDDVSHGELLRDGVDQTMTIDACNLRFLYQGRDPASGGEYSQLPYRLGLLTFEP